MLSCGCIQHIVGCNACQVVAVRNLHKHIVAHRVQWVTVIPHFHQHVVITKRCLHLLHSSLGRTWSLLIKCARHHTITPARHHPPVAHRKLTKLLKHKHWMFFATSKLASTNCTRQVRVAPRVASDDDETSRIKLQLCAKHCWQPKYSCCLGKTHDAIQAISICQRKCFQPQRLCLLYKLFGMRSTLQK